MPLSILNKLFSSGPRENKVSFYKLYTNIKKWNQSGSKPYPYELPDSIVFPDDFWKKIIRLYKATRSDGLEREISVFWADGDLIITSEIKGSAKSVTSKHNVSVRYIPSHKREYYKRQILVDGSKYSEREVYYKKKPKVLEVQMLFNMHTHPPHTINNQTYYSFFSAQDIKSLVMSSTLMAGMISDKFSLLIQTKFTPTSVSNLEDSMINQNFLVNDMHLGLYVGDFKRKLVKVGESNTAQN